MSIKGLTEHCRRMGFALVDSAQQQTLTPSDGPAVPDDLYASISRAQQHCRIQGWTCFRLQMEHLWIAIPPSVGSSEDELQFLRNQLAWIEGRDPLSGLMTRTAWHKQSLALDSSPMACGFIRIANLNRIAHRYGTRAADIVLQTMGGRIAMLAEGTVGARVSNDGFHFLVDAPADLTHWIAQTHRALAQPAHLEFGLTQLQCHLGIALTPEHGSSVERLSMHAEMAGVSAEQRGFHYLVFDRAIAEANRRRDIISRSSEAAFEQGQLAVHYQPQRDLTGNGAKAAEALIRWEHPELGAVGPDEFIHFFERQGLMKRLTQFVLETVIRDWKRLDFPTFRVSINLPPSLVTEEFCNGLIERCRAHGFAMDHLTFEITEQRLVQLEGALNVIKLLQNAGARIAIDDFGVGESSLSRIGQIQFNELKIDRSLVTWADIASNQPTVIRSIVSLARALDMEVVAEGVETEQQCDMLIDAGCDRIQGYWHAKPMPFEQLKSHLAVE